MEKRLRAGWQAGEKAVHTGGERVLAETGEDGMVFGYVERGIEAAVVLGPAIAAYLSPGQAAKLIAVLLGQGDNCAAGCGVGLQAGAQAACAFQPIEPPTGDHQDWHTQGGGREIEVHRHADPAPTGQQRRGFLRITVPEDADPGLTHWHGRFSITC